MILDIDISFYWILYFPTEEIIDSIVSIFHFIDKIHATLVALSSIKHIPIRISELQKATAFPTAANDTVGCGRHKTFWS